jgi:predicted enzyme related to lactoylglutathione lyase
MADSAHTANTPGTANTTGTAGTAGPAPTARLRNVLYPVTDLDLAVAFYRDGLGLAVRFQDGSRYAALDGGDAGGSGGVTLALAGPGEDITGAVAASFKVTDVGAAARRLTEAGGQVVRGPEEGPHETRAVLRDPAGNPFVIYAPRT